jgi:hypothetical protein
MEATAKAKIAASCLLALSLLAGAVKATDKWRNDHAEWRHWRAFVLRPMHEVFGPDKPLFGYLPGTKALFAPFVRTEPAGFVAFVLLNVLSCIGIYVLLDARIPKNGAGRWPGTARLWLSLCCSAPFYLVVHNNQVVAPAVLFALLAFALLQQGRRVVSGGALAAAALIKTLPLALFPLPLLMRSWQTVLAAVLALVMMSLTLSSITEGVDASLRYHLEWPSQILAQHPQSSEDGEGVPGRMKDNQSPAALAFTLTEGGGSRVWTWGHRGLLLLATALLVGASLPSSSQGAFFWCKVAAWMAWIPFGTPYCRYYYLLFAVPAWYALGLRALVARKKEGRKRVWFLPLPLLAIATKNYPLVTAAIAAAGFLTILCLLALEAYRSMSRGPTADSAGPRPAAGT